MDIEEKRRRDEASSVAQTTPTGYLDSIDSATLTLMAGICLSVPAMISLSAGEPKPLSPMPLLVVVPAFLVHVGAVIVPVLLCLCVESELISRSRNCATEDLLVAWNQHPVKCGLVRCWLEVGRGV